MSIDLEAQVLAVAEAMRVRDTEVDSARHSVYYINNREYILAISRIYRLRNRQGASKAKSAYYILNKKRINTRNSAYYLENREQVAMRQRAYYASNSARIAAYKAAYCSRNAKKMKEYQHNYYASRRVLTGQPRGEEKINSKLTEGAVRNIRRRYDSGESQKAIAESLAVSRKCIGAVLSGRTWKHVI